MNLRSFFSNSGIIVAFLCLSQVSLKAQSKFPPVDKSPLDFSYYPANYPILRIQEKVNEPVKARVTYSRPQKNGRKVFGELVEYGSIWRLGANESTEIELFRDAQIGTVRVKKGRYTMYAIPKTDKWTIILNRETDVWGAFLYDPKKDVVRTEVTVQHNPEALESFSMYFDNLNGSVGLFIGWDTEMVRVPISFF